LAQATLGSVELLRLAVCDCRPASAPQAMLSPRAMFQEGEAVLAEQGKGEAVRPESDWPSSAPTRCPTSELLAFDDDQDADVHKESWGTTARWSDELALLETASWRSAMPAPRDAPLRRLRSEAFWEQKAAAARRPECSPWELGVRQRRPCLGESDFLEPAAVATPAAQGADGEGAGGSPRSWAGAISRELRRGACGPVAPQVSPPGSPSAALGAALRSRSRSYHLAGSS